MNSWSSYEKEKRYTDSWRKYIAEASFSESFAQQKKLYTKYNSLIKNQKLAPPSEAQLKEAISSFPSLQSLSLENILNLNETDLAKIVQEYDGNVQNLTKELSFVFYSIIMNSSLEDIMEQLKEKDEDIEKLQEGLFSSLASVFSNVSKQKKSISSKNADPGGTAKQLKYMDIVKQRAAMAVSLLTVKEYSGKIDQIIKSPTRVDPSQRERKLIDSKKRYAQFVTSILQRVEADRRQEAIINAFVKLLTQGADKTVANYYNNDQQSDLLQTTINQLIDGLNISSDKKQNIRQKNDDLEEDLLDYLNGN